MAASKVTAIGFKVTVGGKDFEMALMGKHPRGILRIHAGVMLEEYDRFMAGRNPDELEIVINDTVATLAALRALAG